MAHSTRGQNGTLYSSVGMCGGGVGHGRGGQPWWHLTRPSHSWTHTHTQNSSKRGFQPTSHIWDTAPSYKQTKGLSTDEPNVACSATDFDQSVAGEHDNTVLRKSARCRRVKRRGFPRREIPRPVTSCTSYKRSHPGGSESG